MANDSGNEGDLRERIGQASGGEPAAGLDAEGEGAHRTEGRGDVHAAERPDADEVTDRDRAAQTDEAERVQQSGEGIRGYGTGGREDYGSEDEIRRAAEESD